MIYIENLKKANLKNSFYFITEGFYGGDQSWFVSFYPKDKKGEIRNKYGCGPTSAANITAYYAKYYPMLKDLYSEPSWDAADYARHMDKMYSFSPGRPMILPDYIRMVKSYASQKNIQFSFHKTSSYGFSFNSCFSNLINNIKDGIDHNAPVALLIGPAVWKGRGIIHSARPEDVLISGNMRDINSFKTHWVTITGYDFEKTDAAVAAVSSWGEIYTLNLSALMNERLFLDAVWVNCDCLENHYPV